MNYKHLFFALLCVGLNNALVVLLSADEAQPLQDERRVRDLLMEYMKGFSLFENQPVDILFFDINHDGILDALVSFRMDKSYGGCHGNDWMLFRFENGEWEQSPFKNMPDGSLDPSGDVWARGDDFYSLTRDGQPPKLVLIYSGSSNVGYGIHQGHDAHEITIDDEGYLKTIPIPELTTQELVPHDGGELPPLDVLPPNLKDIVTNIPSREVLEKRREMSNRLVPLSIESFDPREAQKPDEKKQAVADDSEGRAAANREIRDEESGMEGERPREPNAPAGRWLYLAALPLVLAVLYFMRRRKG
ncbi:MAG: hypothetical protein FWG50_07670 [Kiritimatiellaeota bacterium]|nr:hypothetical protein [Kiritimatiellota bacterium]